jgi:hypothetical protein
MRTKPTRDFEGEWERLKSARARLLTLVTDPDCHLSSDHVKDQLREINVKTASEAIKRLALPPTDGPPPMLPATSAPTEPLSSAARVA